MVTKACGSVLRPPEAMQDIFSRKSDYHALGITIYELLLGFTPFRIQNLHERMNKPDVVGKINFPSNFPYDMKKLVLGFYQEGNFAQ
ncbi:hypothetical protein [Succinimonas sp.]|uniref:hypothetical protein n=1 Tax=Succinimonas sp. TaxID=1936151 RepID=UPI003869C363